MLRGPAESRALDGRVHHAVIASFVTDGVAPKAERIAARLGLGPGDVEQALRRLAASHGLVLDPGETDVWIAHPFSASPASAWVANGDRGWWAPCLWCAMGIVALAAPSARVHTRIGGEDEPLVIDVRDGVLVPPLPVVHFARPPREAWNNVVRWCATVQPFWTASAVGPWCARHAIPPGAVVPLDQVLALARAWYGGHLDETWRKWTTAEAQAIFEQVGLTGDFWRLSPTENGPAGADFF